MRDLQAIGARSLLSTERIVWMLVVVLVGSACYFVGQKNTTLEHKTQVAVDVVPQHTDVSNEIDKSFGWSKAPSDMKIEAFDAVKGVRLGGEEFPHPMPALKLAFKNVGPADLESFGINVLIVDELNKRKIASYGQASGSIKQGWTSDKILFAAGEADWKDAIGSSEIDFPVTMTIYASVQGGDKEIFRAEFAPLEIRDLQGLTY